MSDFQFKRLQYVNRSSFIDMSLIFLDNYRIITALQQDIMFAFLFLRRKSGAGLSNHLVTVAASVAMAVLVAFSAVSAPFEDGNNAPVNFQAKQLSHDDQNQTVTAIGDVELIQGSKILRADKMVYNLATDTVSAMGNVSLLDEDGSVHFAEYLELTTNMKQGFIHHLLSMLSDGSRFTAVEATREEGVKTTMTDATYTPCKVCEADPKPVWQIKAEKVVHDEVNKTVKYKNARLELLVVPLAYIPLFSHADPSVKR